MKKSLIIVAILAGILGATAGFSTALAQTRPPAQSASRYYVEVSTVRISSTGVRTTTDRRTLGPYRYFADAAGVRNRYNGVASWRSGGYRYYYQARVR